MKSKRPEGKEQEDPRVLGQATPPLPQPWRKSWLRKKFCFPRSAWRGLRGVRSLLCVILTTPTPSCCFSWPWSLETSHTGRRMLQTYKPHLTFLVMWGLPKYAGRPPFLWCWGPQGPRLVWRVRGPGGPSGSKDPWRLAQISMHRYSTSRHTSPNNEHFTDSPTMKQPKWGTSWSWLNLSSFISILAS